MHEVRRFRQELLKIELCNVGNGLAAAVSFPSLHPRFSFRKLASSLAGLDIFGINNLLNSDEPCDAHFALQFAVMSEIHF